MFFRFFQLFLTYSKENLLKLKLKFKSYLNKKNIKLHKVNTINDEKFLNTLKSQASYLVEFL